MQGTGVQQSATIIDVGGGASTLVDDLLESGYFAITVLDLSEQALATAKARLGASACAVQWIEADITSAPLPSRALDVWHDRAVFHFLTEAEQRHAYMKAVLRTVKPVGHVIVATFAEDGPLQCSGLPVKRYNANGLHSEFGEQFTLLKQSNEEHHTPNDALRKFIYCYCRNVVGLEAKQILFCV